MQALVKTAIPLFIFAATMCRFIVQTNWDCNPQGKLAEVLRSQSTRSLTQLENSYLPVLAQIFDGDITVSEREDRIQQFRDIVGSIVILSELLLTTSLAISLGKPKSNVNNRLHRLHSVLRGPPDPKSPVRLFQLSFRGFLIDRERKRSQFWVDETGTYKKIAFRCLDLLLKTDCCEPQIIPPTIKSIVGAPFWSYNCLKEDICSLKKPDFLRTDINNGLIERCLPPEVQYAYSYWVHHLEQGRCHLADQDQVHTFLEQRFLYWLEALSLIGRIAKSVSVIATL